MCTVRTMSAGYSTYHVETWDILSNLYHVETWDKKAPMSSHRNQQRPIVLPSLATVAGVDLLSGLLSLATVAGVYLL